MVRPIEVTWEEFLSLSRQNEILGRNCSLIQVEFGLVELKGFWCAYQDYCDHFEISFHDKMALIADIANELNAHFLLVSDLESPGLSFSELSNKNRRKQSGPQEESGGSPSPA